MSYYTKIASSSADGQFSVTEQLFDTIDWDFQLDLLANTTGLDYYEVKLAYAKYCQQHSFDDEALETYTRILDETVKDGKPMPMYKDIPYQAYCGLSSVTFQGSDYTWESGVGIVDMYRKVFEKPNNKTNIT